MAAEPIKLNLAQKKAIKEANEGALKGYMETISKAMGQPITFEWTVEQTLTALQADKPAKYEEYKDRVVKITSDSYVKSLSESFGRNDETLGNPVIIEELKKIWTTGKLTFTVLPGTTKPDFTKDVAIGSRDSAQNGIRIVDGTLDIWTNVDNYYCAPDALYTFDWKVFNLFNNVPNDGFSVKAKMQMSMPKYAERMTKVEKELKDLGAPADLKFDPVTDFKTIVAAKPKEEVTLDRLYQYYEKLKEGLKYKGMNDPDVKEAILDVWKGKVRVDIVDSLAAVSGTKEVNTYNGVKFDGDVLVILIEKQRWACGIDTLERCEWVKLF